MYKETFDIGELKNHLERGLGFAIGRMRRLGGGGALNYKVERASDGFLFVLKCFVAERRPNYDRLVANLRAMEGTKAPRRLFEGACPESFAGMSLLCLEWKEGRPLDSVRLTDRAWRAFLKDYLDLTDRMQQAPAVRVTDLALKTWREQARALCVGLRGRILRPALAALEGQDLGIRSEELRVIHGDFHTGNVLFRGEKVEGFMDLESLTMKPAPMDILLYCRSGATGWRGADRPDALKRFGEAVRFLPYGAREWQTAINVAILAGLRRRTKGFTKCGLWTALQCAREIRGLEGYRQMALRSLVGRAGGVT